MATAPAMSGMGRLKLYEIPSEYRRIMAEVEEAGGELTEELLADLGRLEDSLQARADQIVPLILEAYREAEAAAVEGARLYTLSRQRQAAADRMKRYLKEALEATGERRLKTDRTELAVCKNGRPSITWQGDLNDIPLHLAKVEITRDYDAALAELRERGSLPEGFKVEHGTHLRIK